MIKLKPISINHYTYNITIGIGNRKIVNIIYYFPPILIGNFFNFYIQ